MKIGILTSGGDCPGLNAVIRGVVLKGTTTLRPRVRRHPRRLAGRRRRRLLPAHPARGARASRRSAARSSARAARTPTRARAAAPRTSRRRSYGHRIDGIIAIGGEGTLAAADRLAEGRHQRPRRAEDDRQRPARHRLLVRLRHRRQHRHRGDGPAAHHRRLAPALHGRRGHGPPRRLDRAARRAWPPARTPSCIPEVPHVDRRDLRAGVEGARPRPRAARRGRPRASRSTGMDEAHSATRASTPSTARASAASASCSRPRSSGAPASRPARRCSATSSAAARRPRFDRVLATRLGLHAADAVVDGAWGQMVALRGTDIVRVPFAEALGELNTRAAVPLRRGRGSSSADHRRAQEPSMPLPQVCVCYLLRERAGVDRGAARPQEARSGHGQLRRARRQARAGRDGDGCRGARGVRGVGRRRARIRRSSRGDCSATTSRTARRGARNRACSSAAIGSASHGPSDELDPEWFALDVGPVRRDVGRRAALAARRARRRQRAPGLRIR